MTIKIEPELAPTDQLLDAWARDGRQGQGGGMHPLEVMRLMHEGQVLGSDTLSTDEILMLIDKTYLGSPAKTKALIDIWYKSGAPAQVKAKRLGISRAALYTHWKAVLWYFRGALRAHGLHV